MDRATAKKFRTSFAEAAKTLEKEFDCKISIAGISFDDDSFSTKLSAVETPKDGKSIEQSDFEKQYLHFVGLEKSDYGMTFLTYSGEYALVALKPRSPKYPIVGKCVKTGKRYKFPRSVLNK